MMKKKWTVSMVLLLNETQFEESLNEASFLAGFGLWTWQPWRTHPWSWGNHCPWWRHRTASFENCPWTWTLWMWFVIGDTVLERISQFTHFVVNESGDTTVMCVELFSNPGAVLPNRYACRVCGTVFCPHPALLCLWSSADNIGQEFGRPLSFLSRIPWIPVK